MAYKKRFYKKRAKKYYRKYKTLSKRNIFTRKNAKSQASQIYALNKRITRIEKKTRPEPGVYLNDDISEFHTSFTGDEGNKDTGSVVQYPILSNLHATTGEKKFEIQKNLIRIQDIKLYLKLSRSVHSKPHDIVGRITILKLGKISSNRDIKFLQNIDGLPNTDADVNVTGNFADIVNGPLTKDITTFGKVIYDRKFKMKGSDDAQMTYQRKIKLFGQTVRKSEGWAWPDLLTNDYIVCVSFGFVPLSYHIETTLTNQDIICMEMGTKITYIDEVAPQD